MFFTDDFFCYLRRFLQETLEIFVTLHGDILLRYIWCFCPEDMLLLETCCYWRHVVTGDMLLLEAFSYKNLLLQGAFRYRRNFIKRIQDVWLQEYGFQRFWTCGRNAFVFDKEQNGNRKDAKGWHFFNRRAKTFEGLTKLLIQLANEGWRFDIFWRKKRTNPNGWTIFEQKGECKRKVGHLFNEQGSNAKGRIPSWKILSMDFA